MLHSRDRLPSGETMKLPLRSAVFAPRPPACISDRVQYARIGELHVREPHESKRVEMRA